MSTPQQSFRIMFVDDEKDILRVVKRGLESHKTNHTDITFTVDTFQDSQLALQSFQNHSDDYYDLILSDLRMQMSGFDFLMLVMERNPMIKFAFMTAYDSIEKGHFANYLLQLDPTSFIFKPITVAKLIPRLMQVINN
jgi:CheY-like chemotaxis protein